MLRRKRAVGMSRSQVWLGRRRERRASPRRRAASTGPSEIGTDAVSLLMLVLLLRSPVAVGARKWRKHSNMPSCCESICALRSVRACMYEADDSLDKPPPARSRALSRLLDAEDAVRLSGSGSERLRLIQVALLDTLGWLGVGARSVCSESGSRSKSLTSGVHSKSESSSPPPPPPPPGAMDTAIRSRSA